MSRVSRSVFARYAWVFLFLIWGGVGFLGVWRTVWLRALETDFESRARNLAATTGNDVAAGEALGERRFRDLVGQDPRVGYVVAANFRTGYRMGVLNAAGLASGGQPIVDFLILRGREQTLDRLMQRDAGFANPNLDVFSVALLPPAEASERTPLGALKVAYVVPGYPYGRGYGKLWQAALGAAGALTLFLMAGIFVSKRAARAWAVPDIGEEGLADLRELEAAMVEESAALVDEQGRAWQVLFNGLNLDGWQRRGEAYVSDGEIALQPWGASLVRERAVPGTDYHFQLRARKLAGVDGLIVLFVCDGKTLAWVVGGWGNSRSEVAGYPDTVSAQEIRKSLWYKFEVRVGPERLEGFINDQPSWSLPRAEVRSSSPELGFNAGIGIAVWNTLAKFKDLRLLNL